MDISQDFQDSPRINEKQKKNPNSEAINCFG